MTNVELIPILKDNYVFVILNHDRSEALVVDPGESLPVSNWLRQHSIQLTVILVTHHHNDHIQGVQDLKSEFAAQIYAPAINRLQIAADHYLNGNENLQLNDFKISVMNLPGHTHGHIAYWFSNEKWLFSGDVLFGLGCGRLFEGTYEQAFSSLQKIKSLPDETQIFCTHEYTEANLKFCKSLPAATLSDLQNYESILMKKRNSKLPSVPLTLSAEKRSNPFLVAKTAEEFKELRILRNQF